MFFKKSREAAQAEIAEAQAQLLKTFDDKHAEALQSRDPAERILKLEDQKLAIDTLIEATQGKLNSKAKGKWLLGYLGGTFGSNIAFDAISILTIGVPVSALMMIPSVVIGFMTGGKRVEKAQAALLKENEPLFAALREKKVKADLAIDTAMQADMRDLAESPKFQEALQRVPRLRDKFAEAYRKHVIEGGMSGDTPKKRPPAFNP